MGPENCTAEMGKDNSVYQPPAETRRPDPANAGDALVCELGDRAVAALAAAPETTQ